MATSSYRGTSENEVIEIKNSSPFTSFNGRGGDDIYVISPKLTKSITIADNSGNNIINLPNGISIKSTVFYADQVDYTLSTGAVVSVLGGANVGNIKFVWGDLDLDQDLSTPEGQAALTADAKTMSFTETATAFGIDVTKLSNDTPQETTKPVQVTVSVVTDSVTGKKTVSAGVVEETDVLAPVYVSSIVSEDGKSVVLTYDDTLSAVSAPVSAFSVIVDGNKVFPTDATVADKTVTLMLADAVTQGQSVAVSYVAATDTTPASATDLAVQDLKGNNSMSLSGKTVSNGSTVATDVMAPEFVLADAQVDATGTKIILPYSESLGAAKPASSAFKVTVDGRTASPASVTIDGKTVVLTVNKAIITGATVSVEYTAPAVASTGKTNSAVQDLAGNDATGITAGTVIVNNSAADGTAPKILSTTVAEDGKSVVLVYGEKLGAKTAGVADFEIKVNGTIVRATTLISSEDTITLALPRTVTSAEKVTISYTAPVSDATAANNATQDIVGNDAVSLVAVEATNNSQGEPAQILTTAVEAVTGTGNDDVFSATVSSSASTLNATDTIDGGAGDNTLNVVLDTNFDGFTGTGSLKNVQNVNLSTTTSSSADGFKFNATGAKGITKYSMDGAKTTSLNVEGAASLAEVSLYSLAAGKVGLTYDTTSATSPALAAGTNATDNQKVTVTNVGSTSAIDVAINGVETLTLTSAGTSNKVALANTAAKTINVAGDAPLTVTSVGAALTAFSAEAAKGGLTADLTGASANLATVKGGQGADTITVDLAKLTSSAAISGGTGEDTLEIKSATKTDSTSTALALSGVETLKVSTLRGDLVVSNSAFADSNLKSLVLGASLEGSVRLTSSSADFAITSTDASSDKTITIDNSNAATIKYSASSTTVTTQTNALNYTFINAKDVAVTVDKYISATGTIKAFNASNFSVNATDSVLTAAILEFPTATGKGTITTGTNTSSLTIKATQLTELNVTAGGNLTLTEETTAKLSAVKTLAVSTQGTLTAGAIGVAQTVNLSGTSGKVELGDLGSDSNTLGVNLTAIGLNNGLKVGAMKGGMGSVVANISGTTGAVTLGAISSKAKVTIDATKTLGAVSIGAVTGQDVAVTIANAITSFAIGKITADKTVEYKAPSILANGTVVAPISIEGGSTNDALAVTITGGNLNDAFNVTGGAKQASITVTATGLAGTDVLTIAPSTATTTVATKIDASMVSGFTATITDGAGNDTLLGGSGADSITGALGNDSISGGAGNDTITGGVGNDTITGGSGIDAITVDDGTDTITDFEVGADTLKISAGATAKVSIASTGGAFTYNAVSNAGTLVIDATAVTGATTSITGSLGADSIIGGNLNDTLIGGTGLDSMTGGTGFDMFVFATGATGGTPSATNFDVISDWNKGGATDKINFGSTPLTFVTSLTAATAGTASLVGGIATFATDDDTVAKRIIAAEKGLQAGTATAGQSVVFKQGSDSYVFISDGTDGVDANDVLVKLAGINTTAARITSGELFVIDSTPLTAPTVTIALTSDTGTSNTDSISNQTTPAVRVTFTASQHTSASVINLYVGTTLVGTHTVTAANINAGYADITIPALTEGTHVLTATIANSEGYSSVLSTALNYVLDITAPTTTVPTLTVTDNVGLVQGDLTSGAMTDDTSLVVSGMLRTALLDPSHVIAVYDGATRLGIATINNNTLDTNVVGSWTYTDSRTLTNAQAVSYTARAEDVAGNKGTASPAFALTIDTQAPTTTPTITTISADTGATGDFSTSTSSQTISGTLNANLAAGEKVQVSFGSKWQDAVATVGQATWSAANQTLLSGRNTFHARVVDATGNIGTEGTKTIALVPKMTWVGTGFAEVAANNGTIDATAMTATVANATLKTSGLSASDFTVSGLPAGLSLAVVRTSDTVASFTLSGTATTHEDANDVSNLSIAFKDSAFDATTSAGVISAATAEGNAISNLVIDFKDAQPKVLSVSSAKTNGVYKADEVIDVIVTFDKAVTVTGTPTLTLATGGSPNATVNYTSGTGTTALTFSYTVGANQNSTDLNYSSTIDLSLNGGTIKSTKDAADAVLTLPATGDAASLGGSKAIVIDTSVAAPSSLDLATEDDTGAVTNDNITKNTTGLTITGTGETDATVELFNDANNNGAIDTGESLGTAIVTSGTWTKDISLPNSATSHGIKAIQTDVAGNVSVASTALSVTVDTVFPTVTVAVNGDIPASKFIETWDGTAYTNKLTLNGTNFSSLLASGTTGSVIEQLNWNQLTWDVNTNGSSVADLVFIKSTDVASAEVMSDTTLEIVLTEAGRLKVSANTVADTLKIASGFWVDNVGNAQTAGGTLTDLLDDIDRSLTLNITTTGTKAPVSGADVVTVVSSATTTIDATNLTAASKLTVETLATGQTLTLNPSNKIAFITAGSDNAGSVVASLSPSITAVFMQGGLGNNQLGFGSSSVRAFGGDGADLFIAQNLPTTVNPYQLFSFTAGTDHIQFTLSQLTASALGYVANTTNALAATTVASNLIIHASGLDASSNAIVIPAYAQFLFDTDTGILSFDPDGSTATKDPIALITGLPADFTAADITLFTPAA